MTNETAATKDVAKSLHTLSVLHQVASYLMLAKGLSADAAMTQTAEILHLSGRPDPYGLLAKARAQLGKDA